MIRRIKQGLFSTSAIVNKAFDRAVRQTGAVLDSETAASVKKGAGSAVETARSIGMHLTDLNGDGKVDAEDLKIAAQKAGVAWDRIDPDLKTALVAGGVAGVGVNVIPFVGQAITVPTFVATTAYFYLVAKLSKLRK